MSTSINETKLKATRHWRRVLNDFFDGFASVIPIIREPEPRDFHERYRCAINEALSKDWRHISDYIWKAAKKNTNITNSEEQLVQLKDSNIKISIVFKDDNYIISNYYRKWHINGQEKESE